MRAFRQRTSRAIRRYTAFAADTHRPCQADLDGPGRRAALPMLDRTTTYEGYGRFRWCALSARCAPNGRLLGKAMKAIRIDATAAGG